MIHMILAFIHSHTLLIILLVNILVFLVLDVSSGKEWNVDSRLHIMIMKLAH